MCDGSPSQGYLQQYVAGFHFIQLDGERQCGVKFLVLLQGKGVNHQPSNLKSNPLTNLRQIQLNFYKSERKQKKNLYLPRETMYPQCLIDYQLRLLKTNRQLSFYTSFKNDTKKADIFDMIRNPRHRIAINKFRSGNHQLHTETGRHGVPKTPESLRLCSSHQRSR